MAKSSPFAAFPKIAEAWQFFWKQPALLRVAFWTLGFPGFIAATLSRVVDPSDPLSRSSVGLFIAQNDPDALSMGLTGILLTLLSIWGMCGIVVVGRRMIGARSGRARTSFFSVLKEAAPFVRPVFFLSIVYSLMVGVAAFLPVAAAWYVNVKNPMVLVVLALILPAILSTYFFLAPLSVVCEDTERMRGAFKRTYLLVKGKFWLTFRCLLILGLFLALPPMVVGLAFDAFGQLRTAYALGADFVLQMVASIFTSVFFLALVLLYGKLKEAPREIKL